MQNKVTKESLKGQNLGFPLLPHFKRWEPFFIDRIACPKIPINLQDKISILIYKHWITSFRTQRGGGIIAKRFISDNIVNNNKKMRTCSTVLSRGSVVKKSSSPIFDREFHPRKKETLFKIMGRDKGCRMRKMFVSQERNLNRRMNVQVRKRKAKKECRGMIVQTVSNSIL